MAKKKLFEQKVIKVQGAKHHLIKLTTENTWKLHRYGGPAVEPVDKSCKLKKAYYLYGIEYTFEKYEEALRCEDEREKELNEQIEE
jgi:hypothetical protein